VVGVAAPIEVFMVVFDGLADGVEGGEGVTQVGADRGMFLQDVPFPVSKRVNFIEDAAYDEGLAEVVKKGSGCNDVQIGLWKVQ